MISPHRLALVAALMFPAAITACDDVETFAYPSAGAAGAAGAGGGASGQGGAGGKGTAGSSGGGQGGGSGAQGGSGAVAGAAGAAGTEGGAAGSGASGASGGGGASGAGAAKTPEGFLAVRHIRLGDVDASGAKSTMEWPKIGLDLDGLESSMGSKPHCKPAAQGKAASIQEDGEGGIDNSFGRNIVPLFSIASTPPTLSLGTSIAKGEFTLLLGLAGFPDGDTGDGIDGSLFAAQGPKGADKKIIAPTDAQWSAGGYTWNILDSLLVSQSPLVSKIHLPGGVLTGNVWTTQPSDMTLSVPIAGVSLTLQLHAARVKATFAADHKSISQGMIGGVLYTDEFVAEFTKVGPKLTPLLCNSGLLDSIVTSLKQASDIMKDTTQDDAKECDAISIGLEFDAAAAAAGEVIPPDMPVDKPCP